MIAQNENNSTVKIFQITVVLSCVFHSVCLCYFCGIVTGELFNLRKNGPQNNF